eukprot:CAMPEP_0117680296 /NCGR_PEP_ID=MMETSP0804-20121206/18275_1 /TAXON_ID=1074897 /ORGANISM="Tetraselmis astigmatica, Strain CCMP880" /LENGTH=398 /DNA_ID=CAMNT_0005489781 /DNA_START=35 /DNA_END=1228 /DNA_ORIENTATION=+
MMSVANAAARPQSSCASNAGRSRGSSTTLAWPAKAARHAEGGRPSRRGVVAPSGRVFGVKCSAASTPDRVESSAESSGRKRSEGRMVYRPESYQELVEDAASAVLAGIDDGLKFMEVEFPPVPGQVDGYKGSSDTFIDANIQLALVGARKISEDGKRRVHVVLPDDAEYDRAVKLFKTTLEMDPNVTMGYLTEKEWSFKLSLKGLGIGGSNSMYESSAEKEKKTSEDAEKADVFIAVNASAIELLELESYHSSTVGDRPVVVWNLELDTLRADLGLLGFPPKSLQYRFLCRFKSMFYIRQRDYSKTVSVAPFILNYSGALFREYPGPWQVMLKQDNGELACVAERPERYTLSEAKEEMMETMGLNTEEEGSAMEFLRRGYKRSTWWEDDSDKEESAAW